MQNRIMSRRRSAIDIVHDVLNLCDNGGVKKTSIMYRGNLSYDQLRRYLAVLTAQDLIARNGQGHYQLTAHGQRTLKRVSSVIKVLKDLRTELTDAEDVPVVQNGHREREKVAVS